MLSKASADISQTYTTYITDAIFVLAIPYPEPVYTVWSSVHWNATGWPSVHWDTTGPPTEYLPGTLEHLWENLVETAQHWNATGET